MHTVYMDSCNRNENEKKLWKGHAANPVETLEGMVTAVREAGDAALALQV